METLNSLGPKKFVEYAFEQGYVLPEGRYTSIANRGLDNKKVLSFQEFIYCIEKYTGKWKHPVKLNARIIDDVEHVHHRLEVWGIRDPGIREHLAPQCFPGHQEGVWDCDLEETLSEGLEPEEIEIFRKALNIIPKYGISHKHFFHRRPELMI